MESDLIQTNSNRGAQTIGVGAAAIWSAIGTYLIVKILDASVGARVSLEEERNSVELGVLSSE
jgi:ammonia channel protein AmtB